VEGSNAVVDALVALSVAVAGTVVSGIVWGIRLEGQVKNHRTLADERNERYNLQYEVLRGELQGLHVKVDRIIERQINGRAD
jgi:hypothetical protein